MPHLCSYQSKRRCFNFPLIEQSHGFVPRFKLWIDLSYINNNWHICEQASKNTSPGWQDRQRFKRYLVEIRNRAFDSFNVLVVDEPVEEVVVKLRNDGRGDVGRPLTCNGQEDAELPPLLDYFFKYFKPIVLPLLTLTL